MGENSKIEWCDNTWNPWIGCTRVSPACDHCYAETWASRYGTVEWGAGKPRKLTSEANWQQPLRWNREAAASGERKRVFCASLADVFDNEADPEWRVRLFSLIEKTPHLDWLLLTKRIGNAAKMLPRDWGKGWPNVWLGISVVSQEEADRDIPKLLALPAAIRFLSMEPLLGPVDLNRIENIDGLHASALSRQVDGNYYEFPNTIEWVIVGGESGKDARPMHPDWARSLREQCVAADVPFLFKQWGEWQITYDRDHDDPDWRKCPKGRSAVERYINLDGGHGFHGKRVCYAKRVGKKVSGRLLDEREWNEFPVVAA